MGVDKAAQSVVESIYETNTFVENGLIMAKMKPVAIRISDSLYADVKRVVQRRWPNDTSQGQVIRRALEQYVNDADANGKSAKLDRILVVVDWIAAQHQKSNDLQDALSARHGEYSGCDNPPTGE